LLPFKKQKIATGPPRKVNILGSVKKYFIGHTSFI
jgi:hypothetical protein